MIPALSATFPVLLYNQPVDMRKSIDGLMLLVVDTLSSDPGNGTIYVFWNRSRDKLKLLYWDKNGFCLWYKRLEKERFTIPVTDAPLTLSADSFRWLLDGLDIRKIEGFKPLKYQCFF
jgi:transposase